MKRWANTRDQYVKSKNKLKESKRSGAGASKIRKYIYHDALKFLDQVQQHADTVSNIQDLDVHEQAEVNANDEESLESGNTTATTSIPDYNESKSRSASPPAAQPPKPVKKQLATNTKITQKKKKFDDFELKMMEAIEAPDPDPNRHMMFFKGIVPSLSTFSDDQTLNFQMGVLQLIKDIKRQAIQPPPHSSSTPMQQPHYRQTGANLYQFEDQYQYPHHSMSSSHQSTFSGFVHHTPRSTGRLGDSPSASGQSVQSIQIPTSTRQPAASRQPEVPQPHRSYTEDNDDLSAPLITLSQIGSTPADETQMF